MRPEILYPLFAPVTSLSGVGPRIGVAIHRLAGEHVVDLLWCLPTSLIDRRFAPLVADAPPGRIVTLTVRVLAHHPPASLRLPYKVRCADKSGEVDLVFFHPRPDYLRRILPPDEVRVVSGRLERFRGRAQVVHPDHIAPLEKRDELAAVEAVYPLTEGLGLKVLSRAIRQAIELAPELPEWLDPALQKQRHWPSWRAALVKAHAPDSPEDLSPTNPARMRLAYDELLASQLTLALLRARRRALAGRRIAGDKRLRKKLRAALPFALTPSQETAIAEIDADLAKKGRMLRLLQGDVGSGKTVVALFAMLNAVETGAQAALMAPTEVLVRQHLATLTPLAEAAGVRLAVLTGREKGKTRTRLLDQLANGEIDLVVGTHALFQEGVVFRDLAFAVIDEQHRFGVRQRLQLADKGRGIDVLMMTATPIPRTLMLAAYGDLDESRLLEKPAGRGTVRTRVLPLARMGEVVRALRRALEADGRVFWVCPLIEESAALDLAAAEQRHAALSRVFGKRVGLVHGRMKGPEKDAAMAGFASGQFDILVATTVIEVGVDIPQANVMVIEHAERFGLAQLHQLRGRIGRGRRQGACLLLYGQPLGETARARLKVLRETDDGFRIAEEDLRLRGAGELLGHRQSGLPGFRLADLAVHGELLAVARDDARLVIERDADLATPRGRALRIFLYLFERDAAARLFRSA
jgi:ATP-dependent DNA helicase RecG